MGFLTKLFGSFSDKEIARWQPVVDSIMAKQPEYAEMSDLDLRGMTDTFRARLEDGETLDDILPEAFAVCREASTRVLGMTHFEVQLMGGIMLHKGRIAEMKTGEGKTLVATLPVYLNALGGKGVHVVTVNDYLAKRDSEWMGRLYKFLGLSVGLVTHEMINKQRQEAYASDVTYSTNNEFGFDYLRDNMVKHKDDMVQRGQHFALVDEVDSILIDGARSPLIISGQGIRSTGQYKQVDAFVRTLKAKIIAETDSKMDYDSDEEVVKKGIGYIVDEKGRTATLTTIGIEKAERYFGVDNLADMENMELSHMVNQAVKAYGTMKRDVDYVVQNNEVVIVDENTGRLMVGRRFNEGLHQAIEAKEDVKVMRESRTLASITFQNYFRMYTKLAGMTGTAKTEEEEFNEIYGLQVVQLPPNRPVAREDHPDVVYKTEKAKFEAVIEQVMECHEKGQPVLVGTISVDKSEKLSKMLNKKKIPHKVLNAKHHEEEAHIVAQAGQENAVTIATNMAGRGTDIQLGGNLGSIAQLNLSAADEKFDEEIRDRVDYWWNRLRKQYGLEEAANKGKTLSELLAGKEDKYKTSEMDRFKELLEQEKEQQVLRQKQLERESDIIPKKRKELPDKIEELVKAQKKLETELATELEKLESDTDDEPLSDEEREKAEKAIEDLREKKEGLHDDEELLKAELERVDERAEEVPEELRKVKKRLGEIDEATEKYALRERVKVIFEALEEYRGQILEGRKDINENNQRVIDAGGLFIIGTERHESRRIDNQLRGRSGRQGDPGESRFYLSLEDDLMRIFGGEQLQRLMDTLKIDDDVPIENKVITRQIESAQRKIEGRNFEQRKNVLRFDDVLNGQREIIYKQRQEVLSGDDISELVWGMMQESIQTTVASFLSGDDPDNWNFSGLRDYYLNQLTGKDDFKFTEDELEKVTRKQITEALEKGARKKLEANKEVLDKIVRKIEKDNYDKLSARKLAPNEKRKLENEYKEKTSKALGKRELQNYERQHLLNIVDEKWLAHMDAMEELRRGIGLRGYAQRDPVVEYRIEGFEMFDEMVADVRDEFTKRMLVTFKEKDEVDRKPVRGKAGALPAGAGAKNGKAQPVRKNKKIGKNDLCYCGSGKKYKYCHGKNT